MRTDETETRIAFQPETLVEQAILSELFTRLTKISEAPDHPDKVGTRLAFYTLDVPEYDGLDHDLWEEAECGINEHGQIDPEPGSRALVVIHSPSEDAEEEVEEQDDASEPPTEAEVAEAVEALAEDAEEPEVAEEPPFDVSDHSVAALEEDLEKGEYDAPELRALYEAELNDKARKTALEAIERELDDGIEAVEEE